MNGLINLVGSGEYLPVMKDVDRYLLDSLNVNGRKPRVVCLPTAAGKEGDSSVNCWSNMGIQHFTELGAEVNAPRSSIRTLPMTLNGILFSKELI